ncbi:MAG TPA: ABC transporter substrate-binding protein [Chloroflexota bacterium]|jgi:iron(III) transport system substrate-binding protein|nr:ABC transporter substrate-binding protein [Chloroflexota bacterium]
MQHKSRLFTVVVLLIGLVLAACGPSSTGNAPGGATAVAPAGAPGNAPTAGTGGAAPTVGAEQTRPPASTSAPAAAGTAAPGATGRNVTGKLVVYSALNESTNNAFLDAFKKAYPGITGVDVLPLPAAGELQTRIRTEKNSPKGDVFIGGSSEFHDPLGKEGLLEPYKSPNAADVDARFKDANGNWTGWYIGIFGLVINKDRWSKEMGNRQMPKSWDDLLDADLQGKLDLPDPIKTGGGYIFLADQVFRFGRDEEKAMEYMKKLHPNIGQYVGTSPQGIELVGQGQFLMGPNWGHDILTAANQGQPVQFVAPDDTANEVGAVSIIKGGPNTEAAKAFVDWVLTKEAGELNVKLSNRLSVHKDVPPASGAPTLESVKIVDYDRQWATDNKDRLLKKWQQSVGL